MAAPNPYAPATLENSTPVVERRSNTRRIFVGVALGCSLPLLLGSYGLSQESAYNATLPPGTAACGNGALGPIFLIVFVAPFFGFVGGVVARLFP